MRLRLLRLSASQIAAELGAAQDTVSAILQEPEVVAAIDEAERTALEDAQQILRTSTKLAARVLIDALKSRNKRIAIDAAKTLLTKAGADAPSRVDAKSEHTGTVRLELTPSQAQAELDARLALMTPAQRAHAEALLEETKP